MGAQQSADADGTENSPPNLLSKEGSSGEKGRGAGVAARSEGRSCLPQMFGCDSCCNNASNKSLVVSGSAEDLRDVSVPPWKEKQDASVMDLPISHFPLHQAAHSNDASTADRLIAWGGCDVNGCDEHRRTPLHHAAHRGHAETVRVLLKHRGDVTMPTANGHTVIQVAENAGHVDLALSMAAFQASLADASTDASTLSF